MKSDCQELQEKIGGDCCLSCHDDYNEYGYDLIEVDYQGKRYYVCCQMSTQAGKWDT